MEIKGMWCLIDKFQEIVYVFPTNGPPPNYVPPPKTKLVFFRFEAKPSKPPKGLPRPRAVKVMPREFTKIRN